MSKHLFSGTGVAIATPFTPAGDLDMTGMEKLVEHLIKGGVEYLVVLGTTGESATLNKEEKQEVFFKGQRHQQRSRSIGCGNWRQRYP